ncbi:FAD dependent oxidoreductase [Thiomonas sp. X19]|uniref:NAD(P)/FAD-dependent oxidoreductase n=1 Tax=Thiomonas sp. X19 TaxID=1050370 RepID=UPI000B67D920|nr:FAD-dependent oxidoreductase [Thiomonas sp. X19]SCC92416.1 FAD dependent oxidoreductase [Thiomonas sp. X19]
MERATRVLVVGGGIAGASLASMLAVQPGLTVTLLEREAQCGMHATGRSAALYMPSYGPPGIRALTLGSGAFYTRPPTGFAEHPLLTPRGALHAAWAYDDISLTAATSRLDALERDTHASGVDVQRLSPAQCRQRCPVLRPDGLAGGVFEPQALDLDVDAILQGFLRSARHAGARIHTNAEVLALSRADDAWQVRSHAGQFSADIVVNAAGAWADVVGQLAGARPVGLQPRRRSAFIFDPPAGLDCHAWPMVIDAFERFYFKPDAGALLGSPANSDPMPPQDVRPEELDIATGIWAIEQATLLCIRRPRSTWAGLRSFVADGEPVCGHDPDVPGLFWLAGQGGYGIQTAPALARAAAALLLRADLPADLQALGLRAAMLDPQRLRGSATA